MVLYNINCIIVCLRMFLRFPAIGILIEVDRLQDVSSPYLQIKGVNKEAVAAAGSTLKLDDSYTTKVLLVLHIYLGVSAGSP
ncbi:uridine,cytidine kinase [Sarracenia purpurea var. burkii]